MYLDLRKSAEDDYAKVDAANGRMFMWTNLNYYFPWQLLDWRIVESKLIQIGGPLEFSHEAPLPAAVKV